MTAQYQLTKDAEFSGAIVYLPGQEPLTVPATHEKYAEIREHLLDDVDDDARLLGLIQPAQKAADQLLVLSDRVTFRGGALYFDGDLMGTGLADHIIRLLDEGAEESDWKAYVNFLEKLATNPSRQSREHLFQFIQSNGMTITEDGDIFAYKGVNRDGTSSHAGYGIVNGVVYDNAHLPNSPGAVVEIPRSMVDDNRGVACSTGLHVGNFSYASTFASKLLRVRVSPRDVVSVPNDSHNQKVRVSRYVVIEENDQEYTSPTYFEEHDDDDFAEDVPEYDQDEKVVSFGNPYRNVEEEQEGAVETLDGEVHVGTIPVQAVIGVVTPVVDNSNTVTGATARTAESVTPVTGTDADKVAAFKHVITSILVPEGRSLRGYRGKRVTAKNRPLFTQAANDLGYDI